jgi:hypothetical protein
MSLEQTRTRVRCIQAVPDAGGVTAKSATGVGGAPVTPILTKQPSETPTPRPPSASRHCESGYAPQPLSVLTAAGLRDHRVMASRGARR